MIFLRCFTTCVIALSGAYPAIASAETAALRLADNETSLNTAAPVSQSATTTSTVPPLTLPSEQSPSPNENTQQVAAPLGTQTNASILPESAHLPIKSLPEITAIAPGANPVTATASSTTPNSSTPFSLDGVSAFNPLQTLGVTALFLVAFALFGVSVVKLKKGSKKGSTRSEKPMEIVSSMALGPKRQLMIVRIRDQEIVIASTEAGVTMLTEVANETQRPSLADMRPLQKLAKASPDLMLSSPEKRAPYESDSDDNSVRKSDFLLKALNNLKEKKSTREATSTNTFESESEPQVDLKNPGKKGRSPTLSGNKNGFNKFFATAFEQEASRSVGKKAAAKSASENEESVENVTKMIREKLKNMQPAGQS